MRALQIRKKYTRSTSSNMSPHMGCASERKSNELFVFLVPANYLYPTVCNLEKVALAIAVPLTSVAKQFEVDIASRQESSYFQKT